MKLLRPKLQRRLAHLRYVVIVRPRTIMPVGACESVTWFSSRDEAIEHGEAQRDDVDVHVCKLVMTNRVQRVHRRKGLP